MSIDLQECLSKEQYPDEVVDGIIAKVWELADRLPISMFAGLTKQQIKEYWQNVHYLMILGADVALDYMDKKIQADGKD